MRLILQPLNELFETFNGGTEISQISFKCLRLRFKDKQNSYWNDIMLSK